MDRIDHIGRYFHARRRVLVAYVTPQLDAGSGLRRIGIVAVGDLDSRAGRGLVLFLAQRILLLIGARRDGNLEMCIRDRPLPMSSSGVICSGI